MANVASNAAYIVSQSAVSLWMTPFLIREVGISAFGVIPLVYMFTSWLSIVTTALDSAVSRFLAIDLRNQDGGAANRTFNTALFGIVAVVIALCPVVIVGAIAFPRLFEVPSGWQTDSSWLLALMSVSFFTTVLAGVFAVSPFVYSQFVWINGVNLAGLALRVGLIAFFFSILPARLWYVGVASLAGAIVCLAGDIGLWRRFTPGLQVRVTAFDPVQMRVMLSMSGWLVVNMAGAVLLGRVDLIVVNSYYGSAMTGGYAAVAQLAILVDYLVGAAAVVVRPVILAKYAIGDFGGLETVAAQSVRMLGIGLALPVGLLCGFGKPLLTLWLGPSFAYLSSLLVIMVFHLALVLSVRPLLHVQNAYDRVKWPGIITLASGVAALSFSIAFAEWGRWGYLGIALGVALAWTIKNGLYMPLYTARIMNIRWWTYFPSLAPSIVGTLFVGASAYALVQLSMPDNILSLIAHATAVSSAYAAFAWVFLMKCADQRMVKDILGRERLGAAQP